jgi:uncharacterized protein (TIGR00369 family)
VRKIRNPFLSAPGYHCFGCCPDNPLGLHLEFWQDGEDAVAFWQPSGDYQGWGNVLHGGIQTTLVDEVGAWAILLTCDAAGVTSHLEMKFLKPVSTEEGAVTVRSRVKETKRRIVVVESEIYNSAGELCSRGLAHYFIFSRENAPEHLRFPDKEAFFEGTDGV